MQPIQHRFIIAYLSVLSALWQAGSVQAEPDVNPSITTIQGRVIEAETGQGIPGAFVNAEGPSGSVSAISDADGTFVIDGVPPGQARIEVTAPLREPLVLDVTVGPGSTEVEAALRASVATDAGSSEVVVLTGEAPDAAEPVRYGLDPEDIRVLPGSGNDTLKSLQSMPGVARVPFGLGGLVLRGSSPRDTNVYLDGIEVPLLYHFGGLASFYPSSMLSSLEMVPGGFGAAHGRAQGGIVTMTSRPGRTDRWRVRSEVSLIDASVHADGPGPGGGAWSVGLRRSYVDAVLAFAVPEDAGLRLTVAPRYYDGQLRYDLDLGQGQRVSAMVFGSDDRLSFLSADVAEMNEAPTGQADDGRFRYVSRFSRAALRWQRRDGDVDMSMTPWVGWDESTLRAGAQGMTHAAVPMGVRADLGYTGARGYLGGGLDMQGGRFALDIDNEPPPRPGVDRGDEAIRRTSLRWHTDMGVWLEGLYRMQGDRLSVKPGLRVEHYGLTGEWVLDPRLSLSQAMPHGITIKESLGLYHQPHVPADLDPLAGNPDLGSSYALQSAIGAEIELPRGIAVSATGFYDEMHDVPVDVVTSATAAAEPGSASAGGAGAISRELSSEQFGTYSYQENVGRGRSYGVETMLRGAGGLAGRAGSWIGWLSYTYSRALRRGDPALVQGYLPYVLDQPHVLTALGSVQVSEGWRLGARVRYVSGNPITPVTGSYFDSDTQEYRPSSGALLSERLPAFFQLDLRMDRSWKRSWGTMRLFLDIQNVTNRLNPEGVSYDFDYSERSYTRGLPIFPSLGVEYQP